MMFVTRCFISRCICIYCNFRVNLMCFRFYFNECVCRVCIAVEALYNVNFALLNKKGIGICYIKYE